MHRVLAKQAESGPRQEEAILGELLARSGITLDGSRPFDVQVHNPGFYRRVLSQGIYGALNAYVDGWWDCEQLDELTTRIARASFPVPLEARFRFYASLLRAWMFNLQNPRRALRAQEHYDLGNDLFQAMLGPRLVYSCGYWRNASGLDEAQLAKLDLVARKVRLRPGMRVLDIGCGWGAFAKHAAEHYGVRVVGITISREQCELGKSLCRDLPVELRLQDYRALDEQPFDAVVSIGMFEHVGYKNYRRFLQIVRRHLKPEGLLLLHTIGTNRARITANAWIRENIFPNGMLPAPRQIAEAIEDLFVIEDWQNFGADYDKTLMAWYENFVAGWHDLREKYGPRFFRLWKCYLLTCAGCFRARENQLWQLVLSPGGVRGGYAAVR
jgi:cyclopropane-fatty-acyl-phospholipid synthase